MRFTTAFTLLLASIAAAPSVMALPTGYEAAELEARDFHYDVQILARAVADVLEARDASHMLMARAPTKPKPSPKYKKTDPNPRPADAEHKPPPYNPNDPMPIPGYRIHDPAPIGGHPAQKKKGSKFWKSKP
ncbi:uncharacterized protein B0H18DRAFT_1117174 [Fomitopsis serialis]|uniref:uncharacterized protein n=1 Tax=Fomitopsis serialis TaxID=139415 RepID=UPI0020085916|nr:uncharacterized protein B0H18DRAFT_1117174 [Neoantrodia serialis]KAH9930119.1 hypothetical protein B0H18DRAFT_1117174 [Neoantrodia serialis]